MPTVVVAPMLLAEGRSSYDTVSAHVEFDGTGYIVSAAELAAVDAKGLVVVGGLKDYEDAIRRAIGGVFTGF